MNQWLVGVKRIIQELRTKAIVSSDIDLQNTDSSGDSTLPSNVLLPTGADKMNSEQSSVAKDVTESSVDGS